MWSDEALFGTSRLDSRQIPEGYPAASCLFRPPFPARGQQTVHPHCESDVPYRDVASTTCLRDGSISLAAAERARKRLPWGSRPLHDVGWRRPHTQEEFPTSHFGPSAAFRAPSTVCSAASLAGLFRPAAVSRVSLQGFVPPPEPHRGLPGRDLRDVSTPAPAVARAVHKDLRLQGRTLRRSA